MARRGLSGQKQIQLTVFNNEPEARMAEQRLFQEGIPCITKSLGGGPGLWGTAYNLPHGVYVYEEDAMQARELLGLDADGMTPGNDSARGSRVPIPVIVQPPPIVQVGRSKQNRAVDGNDKRTGPARIGIERCASGGHSSAFLAVRRDAQCKQLVRDGSCESAKYRRLEPDQGEHGARRSSVFGSDSWPCLEVLVGGGRGLFNRDD